MCKGGCKLIFLLATGILFSCGSKNSEKKFFDVPGYFRSEIEYIKANFSTVQKRSIYNGDSTRKEFKVMDMNWEKEFGLFLECDINKPIYYANGEGNFAPAWHGTSNEFHPGYMYKANSKKLNIQLVNIEYKGKNEERVTIEISKSNLISNTNIHAVYEKDMGYLVSGEQHIKSLGDKNVFLMEGKFNE
jgi:hypothetical protein